MLQLLEAPRKPALCQNMLCYSDCKYMVLLYLQGMSRLQHQPASALSLSLMSAVLSGLIPALCYVVVCPGILHTSATGLGKWLQLGLGNVISSSKRLLCMLGLGESVLIIASKRAAS